MIRRNSLLKEPIHPPKRRSLLMFLMTLAIVKVLPEPVTPNNTCAGSPFLMPVVNCAMASGWSPVGEKADTKSNFITFIIFASYKNSKKAYVYYDNKIVLEIDLSEDKTYDVEGYNGNINIEVRDKKIRVVEENSDKHICSNQGYISKSYETIVCLPNKVVITIDDDNYYDTVVR